jgi:FolB domain-containing protein
MEPGICPDRATIHITDLRLRAIIGLNDWERKKPQEIIVNAAISFDPRAAAASDSVDDTLDYRAIKKEIMALVERSSYNLLESLASATLSIILRRPRALEATVRIDKPHALRFARSVSVEMHAQRS